MVYTPCAFYAAQVPECDAVSASTIGGYRAQERRHGAASQIQKRAGIYNLGWVDSGIRFNLWSTKEPKLDSNGHIDIKGFKVRGHPIYNAFLTNYLGAQVINVFAGPLYGARARHGRDERLDADRAHGSQLGSLPQVPHPAGVLSTDLHIVVNLKKWSALAGRAGSCSRSRSGTRPRACRRCRSSGRKRK